MQNDGGFKRKIFNDNIHFGEEALWKSLTMAQNANLAGLNNQISTECVFVCDEDKLIAEVIG